MQDEKSLIKDCKQLVENILSEAPPSHNLILAVITKADKAGIIHPDSSSDFPNFYGYEMDRTKMYLMADLKVISNVPRVGSEVKIMTGKNLVYWDKVINGNENKALSDKLIKIAEATYAWTKNTSSYKNAEIILVFRDKAEEFIKTNKTFQDLEEERRKPYEKWVNEQSKWFTDRLWPVMRWLRATQELVGSSSFEIPLELFRRKKINLEEAKKIIINLENKRIVYTFIERGRTPPLQDPTAPVAYVGESVKDNESIFYDPKTKITLTHEFRVLYEILEMKYDVEKISELSGGNKNSLTPAVPTGFGSASPKQYVEELLKLVKFPKKQKKLINILKDGKAKETKIISDEIPTKHLSSLKSSTLETLKNNGLSGKLTINYFTRGFRHFYELKVSQDSKTT